MPIINHASPLPDSYKDLPVVAGKPLLVFFAASKDPRTGESWCPDVRAALPVLQATFSADDQPQLTYIEVGQRDEYRAPDNVFRSSKWNVPNVPTLARFERLDGEVKEVGRLIEEEILDKERFRKLIT